MNCCPHRKQSLEQKRFVIFRKLLPIARLVAFRQIWQNWQLCGGHFYRLMQLQLLQVTTP